MKTGWTLPMLLGVALGACASPDSGNVTGGGGASSGEGGTAGGRAGSTGSAGAVGSAGTTGTAGTTGSAGTTGTAGTTRTSGTAGAAGTGAAGAGAAGSAGGAGRAGSSGAGGSAGAAGKGGVTGTAGSAGGTGAAGKGGAAGSGTAGKGGATGGGGISGAAGTGAGGSSNAAGVHVVGNQIYDGSTVIRLMGVSRPGGEYSCVTGSNVWDPADGSGNNAATITQMLAWKINSVRIPMNEDCWLSLNGVKTGGATYQSAIQTWVNLLLQNNIYPVLDLHWTENNGAKATGQQPMPDAAHATTFWSQVAAAYANSPKVIFDLFNEPYPDNNMEATAAWTCWRDGGTCTGISYQVAGMQSMVTAVRNAGANNMIVLGGLEYSNDLTQWLTYKPTDPANNLAASWHVYPNSNYTNNHTLIMDANGVAGMVPIVATEIGDANCTAGSTDNGSFITSVMTYLDGLNPPQSYLAWSWSTDDQPILISNYNGTATCEGTTYKAHLLATPH